MAQPVRERHPIQHWPAGLTAEERAGLLEVYVGMLWDQVWWLSLPWYKRLWYRLPRVIWDTQYNKPILWKGHTDPIKKFYDRED